jgi:hypothetical protein
MSEDGSESAEILRSVPIDSESKPRLNQLERTGATSAISA